MLTSVGRDKGSSSISASETSTTTLQETGMGNSPTMELDKHLPSSSSAEISSLCKKEAQGVTRRGRKGHTKSRTGCLNCKKARIKCKENRPVCDYCAHRNLNCQWPELHIRQAKHTVPEKSKEVATEMVPLQGYHITTRPEFSINDFRLFTHFVDIAYPHYPMGNDSIWRHEIPCISTNFDFLLHGMLALSASDIASHTNDKSLTLAAITHRVRSISALNEAVGHGLVSSKQGNAMLATCFALLFQSTLLNDGLGEYMSLIRGCIAIGTQMAIKQFDFVFTGLWGDSQLVLLDPKLQEAPLIDADVVSAACRSLEKMAPLCKTKIETDMFGLLLGMARNLVTSSRDAYMGLRKIYELFSYTMPYSDFREFTNPNNKVCQLLQAHFVAMQLIMTPITRNEWEGRDNSTSGRDDGKSGHWLKTIHEGIPKELERYYEWTLWVEREVYEQGRLQNGKYEKIESN